MATSDSQLPAASNKGPETTWQAALKLPGKDSLFNSMVSELAAYLGRSEEEIAHAAQEGGRSVAEAWQESGLTGSQDSGKIEEFYRANHAYLFDLTEFNARYPYVAELQSVVQMAKRRGLRRVLDFGSGIGSIGIFMARSGFEVTLADVSEPLLTYAKWRFAKHGLQGRFVDLNREELPGSTFDLVTSLDVLEHIPEPEKVIRQIAASMTVNGVFAFNVGPIDPEFPQHISSFDDVLSIIRSCGFRRAEKVMSFEAFQKAGSGSFANSSHRVLDPIWYKGVRRPLVNAFESLGIKKAVKRLLRT